MSTTTATAPWECPLCFQAGQHSERCNLKHREMAPAAPVVHLNGTGWTDLFGQYEAAWLAVGFAVKELCKAAPNGRDYYVQEPGAIERAQDEHGDRVRRLLGVQAELEAILSRVSDQEPRRGNR